MRGIPKTYEIIKNASFPANEKLNNDDIILYLTRAAKDAIDHFTSATKGMIKVYFGLTILSLLIDAISFLSSIRNYAMGRSPYADCALFLSSAVLLSIDVYYIAWINSLSTRVPPYVSSGFTKVAFGVVETLYDSVGQSIKEMKDKNEFKMNQ